MSDSHPSCPICLRIYLSQSRRPKVLACGHTICDECVNDIYQKLNKIKCPYDTTEVDNKEKLRDNFDTIDRLSFYEVFCKNHPGTLASFFSLGKGIALCEDCSEPGLQSLEDFDLNSYLINACFSLESDHRHASLPQALIMRIRQIGSSSNQEKLGVYQELLTAIARVVCEIHSNIAIGIDFECRPLCAQCLKTSPEDLFANVDFSNTESILRLIYEHMQEVSLALLNFDLLKQIKSMHQISISRQLTLLREIRSLPQEKYLDFKAFPYCPTCSTEFDFESRRPICLPCKATHVMCLMCANSQFQQTRTLRCLIDNEIVDRSPEDLPCLVSTYLPWPHCGYCHRPFDSFDRLPRCIPCGHVVCSLCASNQEVCQFCSRSMESLPVNRLAVSRFVVRWLSLVETYCVNHPYKQGMFITKRDFRVLCLDCGEQCEEEKMQADASGNYPDLQNLVTPAQEFVTNIERLRMIHKKQEDAKSMRQEPNPVPRHRFDQGETLQRFEFLLPPKGWTPDCKDRSLKPWDIISIQVEAVCMNVSAPIIFKGISLGAPLQGELGVVTFFDILIGNSLNSPKLQRLLNNVEYSGEVIGDLMFDNPVKLEAYTNYCLSFKINAMQVYRGDPRTLPEIEMGSDSTIFQFSQPNVTQNELVNGQLHLSGPLIKIFYDKAVNQYQLFVMQQCLNMHCFYNSMQKNTALLRSPKILMPR